MGIFDIFTAEPASNAANSARGTYNDARTSVSNIADITRRYNEDLYNSGYGTAAANLGTGYNVGTGAIGTGYNAARGNLATGYDASTGAINTGASNALGYLDTGSTGALSRLDTAKAGLTSAYQPLTDLASQYGRGADLYANALGINGAAGTTAAQNAFTASPSYNWTRDQGIDAINRRRNAAGSLVGGNADRDAIDYVSGLASKEYGSWLDRLSPYNQYQLSATQGAAAGNASAANVDTVAANLLNTTGQNKAGVASSQGTNLANLAQQYYGNQAGLDTSEANTLTNLAQQYYSALASGNTGLANALANNMNTTSNWQVSTVNNLAQPTAKTYTDEASAQLQGSKNLWNLGTNLASLAAGSGGGGSTSNAFLPSSSFLNNSWGW